MAFGFLKKIAGGIGKVAGGVGKGAFKVGKAGFSAGSTFLTTGNPIAAVGAGVTNLTGSQRFAVAASAFPPGANIPVAAYGFNPPTAPPPGALQNWQAQISSMVDQARGALETIRETDTKALASNIGAAARGFGGLKNVQTSLPLLLGIAAVVLLTVLLIRRK